MGARLAAGVALAVAALTCVSGALAANVTTTARPLPPTLAAAPADAAKPKPAEIRADLLYHNYCSVCHGDRGDGRSRARGSLVPPPKDFTTPQAIAELTRDRMIIATAAGRPGTAMVGWSTQLSAREIEAVVDFVIATFMKPRTTATFARGRTVYAQTCVVCHGQSGQGGTAAGAHGTVPARNFAAPQAHELTPQRMIEAVTNGRPGTPMGAYGNQLSKDDIAAVVEFIRVSFMAASPPDASGTSAHRRAGGGDAPAAPAFPGATNGVAKAAPVAVPALVADMTLPFPGKLVGNAARGKKFYDANCATCHGVKGDAQGPRAYFIRPKPRNFLTEESRSTLNRPALFAGVSAGRLGSEMPAWSKVLSDQEIADVSEYVFQTFIVGDAGASKSAKARAQK